MNDVLIQSVRVIDLRFPTSRQSIGSDAVNKDPDYSAAYCILATDSGFEGHGLTFTLGRGTELCVMALEHPASSSPAEPSATSRNTSSPSPGRSSLERSGRDLKETFAGRLEQNSLRCRSPS